MLSNTEPRVGVIGLGNIGQFHAERLVDHGVDLVGGMDVDPTARANFADRYDTAVYDDANRLFDVADAVVVATPNCYHESYTVGALDAGLDVLVEKPLAHTVDSAERIAERARAADGFCMVGFKNRFVNPIQLVTRRQRAGRFGETYHIEANYVRQRGIPGRESWFTKHARAGGGALIDIGIHAIDLALHLLGFPTIEEVVGTTRSAFGTGRGEPSTTPPNGVDDSASAFIRTADGTVSLETAWATNRTRNHGFVLHGTEAGARFTLDEPDVELHDTGDSAGSLSTTTIACERNDGVAAEQRAFLRGVDREEPPAQNTVEEALTVQRVVDAIYRSATTGHAIRPNGA
jgi:predicted dehydrogenase